MKKLLILLFTIFAISVTGQEKQNDATWEETIEFLKEQLNGLEVTKSEKLVNFNNSNDGNYYRKFTWWVSDNEIKLTITKPNNNSYNDISIAKLTNIKSANYNEKFKGIDIIFIKNAIKRSQGKTPPIYNSIITVGFCTKSVQKPNSYNCNSALYQRNDSFTTRTLKAFKHLAYLANQKRKKSKF